MAPRSDPPELTSAWQALQQGRGDSADGWLTIPLRSADRWQVTAGIRFPGREEAVLCGFRQAGGSGPELPRGVGFAVERLPDGAPDWQWYALTRAPSAGLDMFTAMVDDVTGLVIRSDRLPSSRLLPAFLGRIRAWQAFMSRPPGPLSEEAELGLVGELAVLEALLEVGVAAAAVVEAWRGPAGGLHDFVLGPGALEVKATLSVDGFPATVSSLEQLDDAIVAPLFLAAVRACLQSSGETLPQRVGKLRHRLEPVGCGPGFEGRLARAGYADADAASYIRRFAVADMRILPVSADLPRLTRSEVSPAIREAIYELDLDLASVATVALTDALTELGLSSHDA